MNNKGGFEIIASMMIVLTVPLLMSLYHEVKWIKNERRIEKEKIEMQEKNNENAQWIRK